MTPTSLLELEALLARDLQLVAYPEGPWVQSHTLNDQPVLDVLIVGAGQGGLAAASLLLRERVTNILVVDAAPAGEEGIWQRFARMHTLRTPKHVGGPDLGFPSLTYQAWFEAQNGAEAFRAIKYIDRQDWQRYLGWFRRVLGIPVRNQTRFCGVTPRGGYLSATLQGEEGPYQVLTRKLVLAAGIETSGYWWMPPQVAALPAHLRAHTADAIDFDALRGKQVAVIGAGASAFDNAAVALEQGAARVQMFCRREELQRIQPYKVLAYPGFLRHFGTLDDAARWRMMNYLLTVREALTRETWERVTRHPNFSILTGAGIETARVDGEGVCLGTPRGTHQVDFVICGTGFEMDLAMRPELAGVAGQVATWADRYPPPVEERNARLGRYPYLDAGMAFTERRPGSAPWVCDIHCFNFGATLSFGPS
jgi:cation diffusion facilitator CzcD-associated flavoprotein CzcO